MKIASSDLVAAPTILSRHKRTASIADSAPMKPLRGVGSMSAFALDTFVTMFTTRFAWREFLEQTWFVAKVAMFPALMLSVPYVVLTVFTFNVLLVEFGAADLSGAGASLGAVNQIGPFVTVLVVAGAGPRRCVPTLGRGQSGKSSTR